MVQLKASCSAAPLLPLSVAAVQLTAGADKAANIAQAAQLVEQAAAAGADLVVLPEKFNGFGSPAILDRCAEPADGGETVEAMRAWAREHGIWLVGGSITEAVPGREKWFNTTFVFDRAGAVVATYRKVHLFDVDVHGQRYRESDLEAPGDEIVVVEVDGWTVGLAICYDLRFPELFRALADRGAQLLVLPAAFTRTTGEAHWHVLVRARAVENQCYVVAAGDWGEHPDGKETYGHSMIVDPWGVVEQEAADGAGVIVARADPERLLCVRARVPALAHRRPEVYARAALVEGAADAKR